jgi:hypothetical protein
MGLYLVQRTKEKENRSSLRLHQHGNKTKETKKDLPIHLEGAYTYAGSCCMSNGMGPTAEVDLLKCGTATQ